ncbi:MAG: 6-bladed beta-propeller, partial [Candidatus Aminicenantes bacterium]|nr:6-bladed beta-propeller [Candidatus Aminicenantes bacterium]NIM78829.1 6-bladed beta-propeller [Candidatus Aminicenantes bacterium]NIN18084.1 6-bladed beta-propeller [Candidatus Aminicenantes bacterium]NIN41983.1 6-bladed beta-propeller [Candidatus Aminicenantes bacterium]NIN84739.1 6-bladed beta-propeller [Candidatus Aminicenantes bacterium]
MKKRIFYFFILMIASAQFTLGIDKLTQYKLDLLKKYKPEKSWISLEWDKSFSLIYTSPESFLKAPPCIKINNDRIYIVDNMQHKLKLYSKQGDFLRSIGQMGKGPSDLDFPNWLEFQGDMAFIISDNGIDVFDQNFKFLKRIKIFLTAKRFFVIKNNVYFGFLGTLKGKYPFFVKKDINGKVIGQVFEDD